MRDRRVSQQVGHNQRASRVPGCGLISPLQRPRQQAAELVGPRARLPALAGDHVVYHARRDDQLEGADQQQRRRQRTRQQLVPMRVSAQVAPEA